MTVRLPVTVVTGFLGAGKTTLLRQLLLASGLRLAVLVNEFGDVGIDGDLIAACGFCPEEERGERLIELNNGCLCCTVQEDFLPTMEALLERRDRLDGIVVETSGLALPAPLVSAFGWPGIRSRVRVQAVVTVVDGEALAAGHVVGDAEAVDAQRRADPSLDHLSALEDLFEDQLQAADLVLVSRADRLEPQSLAGVIEALTPRLRPGTGVLPMARGQLDPALILDLQRLDPAEAGHAELSQGGHGRDHQAASTAEAAAEAASAGHSHGAGAESGHRPGSAGQGLHSHHDHGHDDHSHGHDRQAHHSHEYHGHDLEGHHPHGDDLHGHDEVDHDHHHHHHDHAHAEIASVVLQRQGHWQRAELETWLRQLIREQPILRLKGRLVQADRALPLQIQAVGPRLECWYEGDQRGSGSTPGLELVMLTAASQEQVLRQRLDHLPQEALSPALS